MERFDTILSKIKRYAITSIIFLFISLTLGCSQSSSANSDYEDFNPVNPYTEEEFSFIQNSWYPPKNEECEAILFVIGNMSEQLLAGEANPSEVGSILENSITEASGYFKTIAEISDSIEISSWALSASSNILLVLNSLDSTGYNDENFKRIGYEFKQLLMNPPTECKNL